AQAPSVRCISRLQRLDSGNSNCGRERAMIVRYTRRDALSAGAGALATAAFGTISPAHAANDSADLIKKFTGGKQAAEGKGKLTRRENAGNGNPGPRTRSVETPR